MIDQAVHFYSCRDKAHAVEVTTWCQEILTIVLTYLMSAGCVFLAHGIVSASINQVVLQPS
jgi:hypothetical protein